MLNVELLNLDSDDSDSDSEASFGSTGPEIELQRPNAPVDVGLDDSFPDPEVNNNPPQVHALRPPHTSPPPEESQRPQYHILHYGNGAGLPLPDVDEHQSSNKAYEGHMKGGSNIYHPFASQLEWEFARWAKFRGPTSSAVSDLLAIDGVREQIFNDVLHLLKLEQVVERLGLSFKNASELNKMIDTHLPGRPAFEKHPIEIGGEIFDVYFRDVEECLKALFSDPRFAPFLKYAPERHFTDESCTIRVYHNMHTGEWWWSTQVRC